MQEGRKKVPDEARAHQRLTLPFENVIRPNPAAAAVAAAGGGDDDGDDDKIFWSHFGKPFEFR